jgi:hypothetical protein
MCDSTTPTSPEPNSRPSNRTPSTPSNVTGSDIASSSLSDITGKLELGSGDGLGEGDAAVGPVVDPSPPPQALVATTTNAITAHRARMP